MTIELEEEDRQAILLALAKLSLSRPGWHPACLSRIAEQHGAAGVTREQLTVLTGFKRSTRDAYIQRLRAKGMIELSGESVLTTDAGVAALGPHFAPLPTGEALRSYWLDRLPEGERRVLEAVLKVYPASAMRERVSEETGFKRSTRDAYIQRLKSRRLVVSKGGSAIAASELLFD